MLLATVVFALVTNADGAHSLDVQRQAQIAERSTDVMPFSLNATTHFFTKTRDGGVQSILVKDVSDARQIALVRGHLRTIQQQFRNGDFSGPTHIHGQAMPGLVELKAAKPGQIEIEYKDVHAGAELTYRSADKKLVNALHEWFDAQLSDHGPNAREGDEHHHGAHNMTMQ
ncbi:aspartate carbamoyltransferase [Paraburkholderia sp. CNPSo 3157]|uniref:Aspartate carbamoyltransferase n=1 Tax=Paraburkholderia franconis TaxID=2654983 RepID=A0A7X1TDX6_9BURK|nr:aspartate carbamoyltransferase [Paraburkholderia franconis]